MTGVSRRQFLTVLGAASTAAALSACGGKSDNSSAEGGSWEFTDDLGQKITRPQRPQRVVAYVSCAAALWDFGVRPVGIYGPSKNEDGSKNLLAGNMDLSKVTSLGDNYTDFHLEKLAELKPDLVIASLNGTKAADRWIIKDDIAKKIEGVCPVYSIQEALKPLPDVISAYSTLAQRLGADIEAEPIKKARKEFEDASNSLKQAIGEKSGLRTEFVYGDTDGFYVASPKFYSTIMYYHNLGLNVARQDDSSSEFLQQLSWEQAGKYPADLILSDIRSFSLTPQQMKSKFATFRDLPAVKANQVGGWNGEPRFSYQQAVGEITALAESVRKARKLK